MNAMGLDFFAPFYRFTARMFFGSIQEYGYLKSAEFAKKGNALFVGAGDGYYLPHYIDHFEHIDFVDISRGMLHQVSKSSHFAPDRMECIHVDFREFSSGKKYDTIYMLFYLDMLSYSEKHKHVVKALSMLEASGELVVLDFKPGALKQRVKLFLARGLFSMLTLSIVPRVSEVQRCLKQLTGVSVSEVIASESLVLAKVRPVAKANIL